MDLQNLVLWGIGLLVTIMLGIWGVRSAQSRRSQTQKAKGGSIAIQSGGDTKINNGR